MLAPGRTSTNRRIFTDEHFAQATGALKKNQERKVVVYVRVSSAEFVRIEVFPKAIYYKRYAEVRFWEERSTGVRGKLPVVHVATFLWIGWQTSVEYAIEDIERGQSTRANEHGREHISGPWLGSKRRGVRSRLTETPRDCASPQES
jgi:hypothetical protein